MSRSSSARPQTRWQRYTRRWLDRHIPPARQIQLNRKNLFIFLSPQGGAYLFIAVLIWIGATNFQNNLIMALCFLLLAILFVVIHQTFANLSGLTLRFTKAQPVFAGETAHCQIELESASDRQNLLIGWPGEALLSASVLAGQTHRLQLPVKTTGRGRMRPGRLQLQSIYPMGLIRCWSWLDLDVEVLVYPDPLEGDALSASDRNADGQDAVIAGTEDFFALRPYVPGDALSSVAWKQYAAGRGLMVREYVDYQGSGLWLDYAKLTDPDPETRLSRLCFTALELSARQQPFGLNVPGCLLQPATGEAHLAQTLRALALCPV